MANNNITTKAATNIIPQGDDKLAVDNKVRVAELKAAEKTAGTKFNAMHKAVQSAFKTQAEYGEALKRIRDEQLYLAADCATFKEYCETDRVQCARAHAYRCIVASEVRDSLPEGVTLDNESQARQLKGLDEKQIAKVVKLAGDSFTAAALKEARDKVAPKPKAERAPAPKPDIETTGEEATEETTEETTKLENYVAKALRESPDEALDLKALKRRAKADGFGDVTVPQLRTMVAEVQEAMEVQADDDHVAERGPLVARCGELVDELGDLLTNASDDDRATMVAMVAKAIKGWA